MWRPGVVMRTHLGGLISINLQPVSVYYNYNLVVILYFLLCSISEHCLQRMMIRAKC